MNDPFQSRPHDEVLTRLHIPFVSKGAAFRVRATAIREHMDTRHAQFGQFAAQGTSDFDSGYKAMIARSREQLAYDNAGGALGENRRQMETAKAEILSNRQPGLFSELFAQFDNNSSLSRFGTQESKGKEHDPLDF